MCLFLGINKRVSFFPSVKNVNFSLLCWKMIILHTRIEKKVIEKTILLRGAKKGLNFNKKVFKKSHFTP